MAGGGLGGAGPRPVHPFPARMAPGIALDLMKGRRRRMSVVDPMAGSGTVLAVARACGHEAVGVDLDPLAVLIAKVWTTPVSPKAVAERAASVLKSASGGLRARHANEAYPRGADDETRRFVRFWFDPTARRQLASLAASISRMRSGPVKDALWCAFSRLIIAKQSGASLAMDLAHSRPHRAYRRAPALPLTRFESAARRVAEGCAEAWGGGAGAGEADVRLGDARSLDMPDGSADMVITSPPYLNAIDYMRCSKFSLVWMGYTVGELRRIRAGAIGTEVGMYGAGDAGGDVADIVSKIGGRALTRRTEAVLARYVHDMRRAVRETARVLAGGGTAAYVVGENTVRGAFIRNSGIIKALAEEAGLEVVSRRQRSLPPCSRYLPPPSARAGDALDGRIRREVVLEMKKA